MGAGSKTDQKFLSPWSSLLDKYLAKIYRVVVSDEEKNETGKWDIRELGEGLILSRVPWEGLMEKLIFRKDLTEVKELFL